MRSKILAAVIVAALAASPPSTATATPAQIHAAIAPAFNAHRASFGLLALAALGDVVTTEQAFHRGCREGNPIYGQHPSVGLLLATHGALVFGAWRSRASTALNFAEAALFGAIAAHNAGVRCVR